MKKPGLSTCIVLGLFLFIALIVGGCTKDVATTSTANRAASKEGAALVFSNNFVFQIDQTEWLDCANGGNGENIHYSGSLHVNIHGTFTNNAGQTHFQIEPQGLKGVGDVTGDTYVITSGSRETIAGSFINGRFEDTYTAHFGIQGPSTHLSGQATFHFTVNANGEVTAFLDNFRSNCN